MIDIEAFQKMTPEQRTAVLLDMQKSIALLTSLPVYAAPLEVTVCIPCGPWALNWVWRSIGSLVPDLQSIPVAIHTTAQSNAIAEASAMEHGADGWCSCGIKEFKHVGMVPATGQPIVDICASRKMLAESVETPYTIFLDADVRMPTGGVKLLIDALKADKVLGMVGIPYTLATDHVKMGCTAFRTEELKGFEWHSDGKCECHALCMWYKGKGMDVRHLEAVTAEHRG